MKSMTSLILNELTFYIKSYGQVNRANKTLNFSDNANTSEFSLNQQLCYNEIMLKFHLINEHSFVTALSLNSNTSVDVE